MRRGPQSTDRVSDVCALCFCTRARVCANQNACVYIRVLPHIRMHHRTHICRPDQSNVISVTNIWRLTSFEYAFKKCGIATSHIRILCDTVSRGWRKSKPHQAVANDSEFRCSTMHNVNSQSFDSCGVQWKQALNTHTRAHVHKLKPEIQCDNANPDK